MPLEIFHSGEEWQYAKWKSELKASVDKKIDRISGYQPLGYLSRKESVGDISAVIYTFNYAIGSPLHESKVGGVLLVPSKVKQDTPVVLALQGHEAESYSAAPIEVLNPSSWPHRIAQMGYVVYVPTTMIHEEIKNEVPKYGGYPLIWTRIISDQVDYMTAHSLFLGNSKFVVVGLSNGGHLAYMLMAYRTNVSAGVVAGVIAPKSFVSDHYKILGHDDCWNIEEFESFTPLMALAAPRPVQYQIGRKDGFYPTGLSLKPVSTFFAGTKRPITTYEASEIPVVLKFVYEAEGAPKEFRYLVHDGGHEINIQEAIKFISEKVH